METPNTPRRRMWIAGGAVAALALAAGVAMANRGSGEAEPNRAEVSAPAGREVPRLSSINVDSFIESHDDGSKLLTRVEKSVVAVLAGREGKWERATGFKVAPGKVVTTADFAQRVYDRGCESPHISYATLAQGAGKAAITNVITSPYGDIAVLTVAPNSEFERLPSARIANNPRKLNQAFGEGMGVYSISWQAIDTDSNVLEWPSPSHSNPSYRLPQFRSGQVLGETPYGIYYEGVRNGNDVLGGFNGYGRVPDGTPAMPGADGSPYFSSLFSDGSVVGIGIQRKPVGPVEDTVGYIQSEHNITLDRDDVRAKRMNVTQVHTLDPVTVDALVQAPGLPVCPK